jgi:hypothetical protein
LRKATLQFLHRERDDLRADLVILEARQREVIDVGSTGRKNVTPAYIDRLLDRLGRFEEMIAAYESGLG